MRHRTRYLSKLNKPLQRLVEQQQGQVLAIFALALSVLVGAGALALDYGHMYVARNTMQNAADAGARAGAVILASGGTSNAASTAAANLANLNLASYQTLIGATPVVTFPAANSVRVNINHNLPLFLASIIGFSNAGVNSNAVAQFDPSTTIPPGFTIPLALYCNNPSGCTGQISVPQTHTVRRYCGNYFANGPSGNACGNSIADGEIFAVGITFDDNNSTADFRDQVRDGYNQSVSMNQPARALPGQRNGWRDGMIDRLAQGRNKMILPVIREATVSVGKYNMEVVDFVYVQVSNFTLMGKSDQTTFTIIPGVVPADGFPGNPSGTAINSVSTVRLIQ